MIKLFSAALTIFIVATTVSVKDFKPALGKWKGTITYLDYTSGKPFTMPCNIAISKDKTSSHRLILSFEYPKEPQANGNDTVMISTDGTTIDNEKVITKENKDGVLQ